MGNTKKKNGFASGIGFILASAGSAVGLGNLCQFPYKTSVNGGAAFVFVYILCVLVLGSTAMIAEIYIGRRAQANTVSSLKKINPKIGWIGLIVLFIPFLIICYYSVLGGWTLRSTINSFQAVEQANNMNSLGSFTSNPYEPIIYTAIFIVFAAVIIMAGVKEGIEKASKVLMPMLFIILLILVVYCLFLGEGVSRGLDFYLNPRFDELGFEGVIAAMGQAFFSLSLGMGIMISYGSYTGKEIKLGRSVALISLFDTLVALFAGLMIFSAIGALSPGDFENTQGVMLIYSILPKVFNNMGEIGKTVSFLFFAMVSIAAVTSVMSLMEVVAQFVIQKFKIVRKKAILIISAICLIISIPISWSVGGAFNGKLMFGEYDILTFIDEMTNTVLMPIGALGACVALGWLMAKPTKKADIFSPKYLYKQLSKDGLKLGSFGNFFSVMVKYVTPIIIISLEVLGIMGNVNKYGNSYWLIVGSAYALLLACVVLYFVFFKNKDCGNNADELVIGNSVVQEK